MKFRTVLLVCVSFLLAASASGQALNVLQVLGRSTGVRDALDVASSPDGAQVYVLSGNHAGSHLAVFSRSAATGGLTFRKIYGERVDGFQGVKEAFRLVMAPDGRNLYLMRRDGITILRRGADGTLLFGGEVLNGINTVFAEGQLSLAIRPDGRFLFSSQGTASGSAVQVFRRDLATGQLSLEQTLEEPLPRGSYEGFLTVSPGGRALYLATGNTVLSLAVDATTGRLSFLGQLAGGIDGVPGDFLTFSFPRVSPDGKHVYVLSGRGQAFLLRVEASGALSYVAAYALPEPQYDQQPGLAISPDGGNVYACRDGADRIDVFSRDAVTGGLHPTGGTDALVDHACTGMAFSPDGKNLYTPSILQGSLLVLARQPGTGALSLVTALGEGDTGPDGLLSTNALAISGDGAHVYGTDSVAGRIGLFRRAAATGRLSFAGAVQEGRYHALLLSPDGAYLYGIGISPGGTSGIGIFHRNPATGDLTSGGFQALTTSCCDSSFAISGDGKHLYVSLPEQNAVAVYQRSVANGELTLLQTVPDGVGTPDAPSRPTTLTVSPDGRSVYAGLDSVHGLAVFQRDPGTGRLTPVQALTEVHDDGACFSRGLDGPASLVVSPDGRSFYASSDQHVPFTFTRNPATGQLTYRECNHFNVERLAASPDGRFLYATGHDGSVQVAYRSPAGRLIPLPTFYGVDAEGPGTPVVSPDSRNVYVPAGNLGLVVLGDSGNVGWGGSCASFNAPILCLQGGRFSVQAVWTDFDGKEGNGSPVPLTPDSGYFWFFNGSNVELVLKVLDARALDGHFWVFYGALSNVRYTILVTDLRTGRVHLYSNPSGRFASASDTRSFADPAPPGASAATETAADPLPWLRDESPAQAAGTCAAGPTTLCLGADPRFKVEVSWKDFSGHQGTGNARSLTTDTGYFWFFDPSNVEIASKVIDGRGVNGHYWFFFASLTNVEFHLTVTDTLTGASRTYDNPAGTFASRGDVLALPAE